MTSQFNKFKSMEKTGQEKNAFLILRVKTRSGIRIVMNREYRKGGKNVWGFPGGKIDRGEDRWQAAVREFREETDQEFDKDKWTLISKFTIGDCRFYYGDYSATISTGRRKNSEVEVTELIRDSELTAAFTDETYLVKCAGYKGRIRGCCFETFHF